MRCRLHRVQHFGIWREVRVGDVNILFGIVDSRDQVYIDQTQFSGSKTDDSNDVGSPLGQRSKVTPRAEGSSLLARPMLDEELLTLRYCGSLDFNIRVSPRTQIGLYLVALLVSAFGAGRA